MSYTRTERIRRAAILVASLDEPLAEQILGALPAAERERVLDEADRLESIDEDEQADVLAEFRRMTHGTRGSESAVEFTYSCSDSAAAARSEEVSTRPHFAADATDAAPPAADARASTLSETDAAAMAELLSHEHPQIIAAALSRLGEEQSAVVFAALPPHLQSEALDRLATLAPADEDAVQEVQSQIQRRLQQRREHQARTAAGAELVRKILARTPPAQRVILLQRMGRQEATSDPQPAAVERRAADLPSPRTAHADSVAQQARDLASAVRRARGAPNEAAPALDDLSADLELLSDESLVAALRLAGEWTVMRALAASGEAFVKRVTNMLPRRQARKLRAMLRNLGPTRLTDLQMAQHELLRLAHDCAAVERAA